MFFFAIDATRWRAATGMILSEKAMDRDLIIKNLSILSINSHYTVSHAFGSFLVLSERLPTK